MKYNVLLVDDEHVELEWLKRRLPWNDLSLEIVAAVNSGFAALEVMKEKNVDILISDIKMPIMSGLELARKVRELSPNVKIAFISGYEDFNYAKKALEIKAFGYVLKPIDNDELIGLLQSMIKSLNQENPATNSNEVIDRVIGQKKERKIIEDIKQYAVKHLKEKVTLRDIAYYMGFSPNYLGHLFKNATGENFSDFISRIRIEKACQYLLDPRVKVYEIVERVGYKNIIYFNRQFKNHFGFSPNEFRKRNKV